MLTGDPIPSHGERDSPVQKASGPRYDYPASCLAEIGWALAPVMPTTADVMDVPAAQLLCRYLGLSWLMHEQVQKNVQPDPSGSRHLEFEAGGTTETYSGKEDIERKIWFGMPLRAVRS